MSDADISEYCDEKYTPKKRPDKASNLHANDAWRGEPGGRNYYSFYAGKLDLFLVSMRSMIWIGHVYMEQLNE